MENPEELLHTLEEYSKLKPKDIPRELEEYLCFVAKTGDPIYQWASIKHLLKEKLINVVNDFHESCPAVDIPPCPNVEIFNYNTMKSFILEKLDTFTAAPFTVQRICELLTTPRKEYNRIDKFMRALEKNILVVSTVEPGCKNTENGESIVNGLESEHLPENSNCSTEINVVEMDENTDRQRNQMNLQHVDVLSTETRDELEITKLDKECLSHRQIMLEISTDWQRNEMNLQNVNVNTTETNVEITPKEITLEAQPETELIPEPVVSSEIVDQVTESEAICSETISEPTPNDEKSAIETIDENLKLADSTTSLKSPQSEIVPIEEIIASQENCEIASSENDNNTDTDSNQSLPSSESDSTPIETKETEENSEDSNSSNAADTTKGYEIDPKIEENKDEEISSTDKIVIAVPNTSIDDISDDESEAEAEVPKDRTAEIVEEQIAETPENESVVTASTDDLNKDCPEVPMEIDAKEKVDFNEAEATCESI